MIYIGVVYFGIENNIILKYNTEIYSWLTTSDKWAFLFSIVMVTIMSFNNLFFNSEEELMFYKEHIKKLIDYINEILN